MTDRPCVRLILEDDNGTILDSFHYANELDMKDYKDRTRLAEWLETALKDYK